MRTSAITRAGVSALAAFLISACAPSGYVVKAPEPSGIAFQGAPHERLHLVVKDSRGSSQPAFFSGTLAATLKLGDAPIDPLAFLTTQLQAELRSRGLPIDVGNGDDGTPRLDVLTYRMTNSRLNAYAPFVTTTFLSADLHYGPMTKRIAVWVKRGKVPVWSFDEVVDPTLNQPLSISVKELAAKVAAALGGYKASDQTVADILARLQTRSAASYLDVYALGFTNNPKAVAPLVKMVNDADDYVRMAALSSLGTLRATSQFGLLKAIHENSSAAWEDRVMSLKAIGDLDTPESRAYLQERAKALSGSPTTDFANSFMNQVLQLYLL